MSDRKKPKKYSKMDHMQKEMYVKDQLKELGASAVYHPNSRGSGSATNGMFDLQESEAALRKAASNDYDRREALKYGVNSGDKRFAGLDATSGFDSMEALVNTDRAIAKYGYNELGHKNMSSDADMAAVTNSLFNKSRDNLTKGMSTGDQQEAAQETKPYTPSQELTDARNTVEEYDKKDFNVYNRGNATGATDASEAGDGNGQRKQAAQSFFDKYKLDVKSAANFKPTL